MIHVVNTHHLKRNFTGTEYIGRGSSLGNPWSHMEGTTARFHVNTRDEAVACYESALTDAIKRNAPYTMGELNRLAELAKRGDLNLRCFCTPKSCHGDVIKKFIERYLQTGSWA